MDLLELQPQGTIGIVTRRVPRSPAVVDLALSAGAPLPIGPFVELEPFRPVPPDLGSWGWRAAVRLRWPRPGLAPEPVVGVELAPWSATTTELRLAPQAAHALHWSDRRWNRYFAVAHAAADALVEVLCSTPTALPSSPPLVARSPW
jgi:hypothetical protein